MKNTILIPFALLATTPFVVACTPKSTNTPSSPVTSTTETVTPTEPMMHTGSDTGMHTMNMSGSATPILAVQNISSDVSVSSGTTNTGTVAPVTLTRTETVSYDSRSPDGMVEIEFSVTITDGVITAASATPKTDKQGSSYNQTNFVKNLSSVAVGKKAQDFQVDAIGGASYTTDAFELFVHSF